MQTTLESAPLDLSNMLGGITGSLTEILGGLTGIIGGLTGALGGIGRRLIISE
jgi:hypothetical protein